MCGLNFLIAKDKDHNVKKWIKNNRKHIDSRGPDNYSELFIEDSDIGFAHSRLAIVDLDMRSNQPFNYKNYTLLFNGEIYNFLEIKKGLVELGYEFKTESDTELLIIGYYHFKDKIFKMIDGMYAFVIYDSSLKTVLFGRDRNAEKPLYIFNDSRKFAISSNFLSLIEFSKISKKNLAENLKYGFSLADRTIYKNILCLVPGIVYKYERSSNEIDEYSVVLQPKKTIKSKTKSFDICKNELSDLIDLSLTNTVNADVPVGLLFSGGVDSTVLLAKLKNIKPDIKAYTISFKEYPEYDESELASNICNDLDVDHKVIDFGKFSVNDYLHVCRNNYHPFSDTSLLPSYLIHKNIKANTDCKVVLSGDGADELFGGYKQYRYSFLSKIKLPFFKKHLEKINYSKLKHMRYLFYIFDHYSEFRRYINDKDIDDLFNDNIKIESERLLFDDICKQDQYDYLSKDILRKSDVSSMLNSIEVRSPFLSNEIVKFANLRCPNKFKYNTFKNKIILKSILRDQYSEYPISNKKSGFSIPVNSLLKNNQEFRQLMFSTFFNQDLFSFDFLTEQIKQLDSDFNNGEFLFSILSFLIWYTSNEKNIH
jgi:asparagine synthase (glutamine-hydrolysing)